MVIIMLSLPGMAVLFKYKSNSSSPNPNDRTCESRQHLMTIYQKVQTLENYFLRG